MPGNLLYEEVRKSLPAETESALPPGSGEGQDPDISIIVLDDDPTGTQTVHSVPVITEWSVEAISGELRAQSPVFFILTNSRSLDEGTAGKLATLIGANIREAAARCGRGFRLMSRSDSTLRGHYPHEVDLLEASLYGTGAIQVLIPAFIEGGRVTVDGIHYVREKDELIPVADTPFALDASFGFKHSRLSEWVREKSKGQKGDSDILSIPLSMIRRGGVAGVFAALSAIRGQSIVIVDAFAYSDLEIVSRAFRHAERSGKAFLYRTGASFVRSYAGIKARGDWSPAESRDASANGGLIVVGSYVPKSTLQLAYLRERAGIPALELDVAPGEQAEPAELQVRRITGAAESALGKGLDVIVYTSRNQVRKAGAAENLEYGNAVSRLLVDIVSAIRVKPRFLIAKGGITSSDIATKSLGVKRAMVLGQLLPGVPVWSLGTEARFPGMPYCIFPGNVGSESALLEAYRILTRSR